MWSKGNIKVNNSIINYCVKHFEEDSEHGINNGRISKLTLKCENEIAANYDRGWDVKPNTEQAKVAFTILMQKYN